VVGGHRIDGDNHACLVRILLAVLRTGRRAIARVVVLHQLPDLLFERHLAQQPVDASFDLRVCELRVGAMHSFDRVPIRLQRRDFLRRAHRYHRAESNAESNPGKNRAHAGTGRETAKKLGPQVISIAGFQCKVLRSVDSIADGKTRQSLRCVKMRNVTANRDCVPASAPDCSFCFAVLAQSFALKRFLYHSGMQGVNCETGNCALSSLDTGTSGQ